MKNKGGRPKGSKNQPTLFKMERRTLKLSRESLKVVYDAAARSGLSPQTVLEDVILAGEFFMRTAYSNLHNLRNRIKEKASMPSNVVPVTSAEDTEGKSNGSHEGQVPVQGRNMELTREAMETASPRSDDVNVERGHRPEDNPAFGNASELGDVIGVDNFSNMMSVSHDPYREVGMDQPDPGPEYTDEDGNPIEPQEVVEGEEPVDTEAF